MPTTAPENTTAARGRNAASKPLNAPAASSTKATVSRSGGTASKPSRTPSASSTISSKSSQVGFASSEKPGKASAANSSRTPSESGFKVTKLSSTTVTLQTNWSPTPVSEPAPPVPAPAPVAEQPHPQAQAADPLQVASQVYPWTYMSSTLDACFQNAETEAVKTLETCTNDLLVKESEISEQLDRLDAERSIEFYDELGSEIFTKEAPAIMKLFHSHGEVCNRIEVEALKLVSRAAPNPPEEDPLKVYQDMLHELDRLHDEAKSLQSSITKLTEETIQSESTTDGATSTAKAEVFTAQSQVSGVFAACLPVLRARLANLSMAQELIDSALENVSLGLRMESMGLTD